MEIAVSDLDVTTKMVTLVGKLDIVGADKIGVPLAVVAGSRANLILDMTGVDFIASIGLRHLVMAAKTVARGAGKLVLLRPTPGVREVIVVSGLGEILPMVQSEVEARAAFAGVRSA